MDPRTPVPAATGHKQMRCPRCRVVVSDNSLTASVLGKRCACPTLSQITLRYARICAACGKRERSRFGTITGWLFHSSSVKYCSCALPDLNREVESQSVESAPPAGYLGDDFSNVRLIGEGGMGFVYRAFHVPTNRWVAVKVLRRELVSDEEALLRFEREVATATKLNHPNLAAIYDSGTTSDGVPYLVMEYLPGRTLAQMISDEGRLNQEKVIEIFLAVTDAIQAAHLEGIIHRDIKPSNIMLVTLLNQSTVKVLDFGIAKQVRGQGRQNLTHTGEVFGSPLYMSPEQCTGHPVDSRSDIYSLGCVMYEALTGKPPFPGANPVQTILKHLNEKPASLSRYLGISPELETLVLRTLEKDAHDRYRSMRDVHQALLQIRDGSPFLARSVGDSSAANPATKQWQKFVASSLVIVAILALCLQPIISKFAWIGYATEAALAGQLHDTSGQAQALTMAIQSAEQNQAPGAFTAACYSQLSRLSAEAGDWKQASVALDGLKRNQIDLALLDGITESHSDKASNAKAKLVGAIEQASRYSYSGEAAAKAHLALGGIELKGNKPKLASDEARAGLQVASKNNDALDIGRSHILLADVEEKANQKESALKELQAAKVALQPINTKVPDIYGAVLLRIQQITDFLANVEGEHSSRTHAQALDAAKEYANWIGLHLQDKRDGGVLSIANLTLKAPDGDAHGDHSTAFLLGAILIGIVFLIVVRRVSANLIGAVWSTSKRKS